MRYDPEISTTDNLLAFGFGDCKGDGFGRRKIFRLKDGAILGELNVYKANKFVKSLDAGAPEEEAFEAALNDEEVPRADPGFDKVCRACFGSMVEWPDMRRCSCATP